MNLSDMLPRLKLFALGEASKLRRKVVRANTEPTLIESQNGRFLVDAEDQYVGRRLLREGEYGLSEIERLKQHIDRDSNVLVLGAHVGTVAIPISHCCRSVCAVEANPRTFRLLQLNVLANGCSNVRVVNIAASDRKENLEFVLSRVNSGGSKRMPQTRDYMYFYDSPEVVTIAADRLDDVLSGERFDAVFMDIEGSEFFALKGMPRILSEARVLFMEFVPHHLRNVSGVTVGQLLELITPQFSRLFVPTKDLSVSTDGFSAVLEDMFNRDQSDDGIVFTKQCSS